jgi:orotate phosphoribosyltransferase
VDIHPSVKQYLNRDPKDIMEERGGHYNCPKDSQGRRLGPLVALAGKYREVDQDPTSPELHFVADEYWDFSAVEPWQFILDAWAINVHVNYRMAQHHDADWTDRSYPDRLIAAPMGGIYWSAALGRVFERPAIFAEKEVLTAKTESSKEVHKLIWGRHRPEQGELVDFVEDVCTNFSSTAHMVDLCEQVGAVPNRIICLFNRSPFETFVYCDYRLPVVALVRKQTTQYRQDDQRVADDVAAGNICWHPKKEKARLREAMAAARG